MKLVVDQDGETLVVRAEHFNEEQLLNLIRNQLNDFGLTQLEFRTIRKGEDRSICIIDVERVHVPFVPGNKDCEIVRDILGGGKDKEG